jgi:preprotein translocase subunit SecF
VFDKVRENTQNLTATAKSTYSEAANLAVNQTLVRSINTSVVALLPVGAILFIGAILLGAGTLKDLSLALFVGIAAGTYSSIFIATPLLVELRMREPEMKDQEQRVLRRRREEKERLAEPVLAGVAAPAGLETPGGASPAAVAVEPKRELRQGTGGQRQQPRRGSGAGRNRPGGRRS